MHGVIPTTPLERGAFTGSTFGYILLSVLVGGGGIRVEMVLGDKYGIGKWGRWLWWGDMV
ncbi:unnamed protein product [Penicillium camemberti]|uniref:Str. FM013 n=1 Tax=Penicillium camemberti (strain FM 013) TaxID=1429867 RepID=A0A0G4PYQ6_PENC3|nr:unnamed protein product [Penicillium camemberti]